MAVPAARPGSEASQRVGVSLSCGSLWFIDAGRVAFIDAPVSPRFLNQDDRIEIADGLARGEPVEQIAARIGKSYQTLYREIARNSKSGGRYQPWYAHGQAHLRRQRPGRGYSRPTPSWPPSVARPAGAPVVARSDQPVAAPPVSAPAGLACVHRDDLRGGLPGPGRAGLAAAAAHGPHLPAPPRPWPLRDGALRQCTTMKPIGQRPAAVETPAAGRALGRRSHNRRRTAVSDRDARGAQDPLRHAGAFTRRAYCCQRRGRADRRLHRAATRAAAHADLGSGHRDVPACPDGSRHRDADLLRRPALALAARNQREYQRAAPPVPAQGHRPEQLNPTSEIERIAAELNDRPRLCLADRNPAQLVDDGTSQEQPRFATTPRNQAVFPGDLHRRPHGEDPRRGRHQPGSLPGHRNRLRGHQRVWACGSGRRPGSRRSSGCRCCPRCRPAASADVCIVCCDGLTGLPDAIGVVWPQAVVQLCVVHLIRASLRYASRKYWMPLARDLRPVYTAADEASAAAALEDFAGRGRVPGDREGCGGRTGPSSPRSWPSRPRSAGSSTRRT